MSQALLPSREPRLHAAIERVYQDAGLDGTELRLGVVPLSTLIGAYPLRVAEIRGLTYRSAREFLVRETRRNVPGPAEGERALAGFLYIYRYAGLFYGCVLLEQKDPVARRRFSAAHELGHYLLHFLPLLEGGTGAQASYVVMEGLTGTEEDPEAPLAGELRLTQIFAPASCGILPDTDTMEDEANRFAAELLMPEVPVRTLAERFRRETGGRRAVLARRLATEFLVSRQAMTRRLETLGLPEERLGTDRPEMAR